MDKKRGILYGITLNIILLGIASLINDISGEMITGILPLFVTSLGAGAVSIGLLGGLSEAGISIFKVLSGNWSDNAGKRKPFVVFGYTFSSFAKFFLALSNTTLQTLIFRPLERLGKGIRDPPRDALMAETTEKKVHGKVFGLHKAFDNTGALIGSVLALFFLVNLGLSFNKIIFISAIIAFFGIIPLIFVKEKAKSHKKISLKIGLKELPKKFKDFLLIVTIFALANFTYMFFILKAYNSFNNYSTPILLYIFYNISYMVFAFPSGILSDKIGRKNALIIGYLIFGLTCLGFAMISSTFTQYSFLFVFYGLAHALTASNERAFASDLAKKELGTALGTYYMFIGLASLPAGIIAGLLWSSFNPGTPFFYGATLAFAAALLFMLNRKLK